MSSRRIHIENGVADMMTAFSEADTPLLRVSDLTVEFPTGYRRPVVRAVDHVSFEIASRETVGLVGESGSGKTTIGRAILGLAEVTTGSISFCGNDITHASYAARRRLSTDLQVVFQDPYSSLNPTRTIGQTLSETLRGRSKSRSSIRERMEWVLNRVGLPVDAAAKYPSHFSGGQRQRVAIARALMGEPQLVICDEPTSALDLSVQAQVLNLLQELQHEFALSYLFISHDLAVVRHLSQRILVLYGGRIMEQAPAAAVYANPIHPYTRALLDAAPVPDPHLQRERSATRRMVVTGSTYIAPAADACPFAPRCAHATSICHSREPALEVAGAERLVACHHWRDLSGPVRQAAPVGGRVVELAPPDSPAGRRV